MQHAGLPFKILNFPAKCPGGLIAEGCSIGPFQLIMSPACHPREQSNPFKLTVSLTLDLHPSDCTDCLVLNGNIQSGEGKTEETC